MYKSASKPAILLAFANDRAHSLRQLAQEHDDLREALRLAEREGKCRLLSIHAATPAKLIQAFQENQGQVAVFHYGGHSNEDELFLHQDYPGQGNTSAGSLAAFLASQPGLELAFLNGCLSLKQAEGYHRAGARALVATDSPIGDEAARAFAQLFYQGLAGGASIAEAFRGSEAGFQLQYPDKWRGLWRQQQGQPEAVPWQLFPEGEHGWRLPLAARRLTHIPAINLEKEFFGREEDMERLEKMLGEASRVVLVNGLGGIGKTVLATAYLQTHGGEYNHLAWINRGENLLEAFALNPELADSLGLPIDPDEGLDSRFRRILWAMQQMPGNNLLVIDNAQEQVAQKEIYEQLPGPPHWKVLLTSRLQLGGFDSMRLDTLAPEAARALFRAHFKGECAEAELESLLEEVGYHTLTIELLARLLDKLNKLMSLPELTAALRRKQLNDPDLQELVWVRHAGEERAIFLHLMKAFELSRLEERELWLLKQFAVLPAEPYPAEMLAGFLAEKPLALNKLLNGLAAKGWLTQFEDKRFAIHRLIRQVAEYQLKPGYAGLEALVEAMIGKMKQDAYTNPITDNFPWIRFAAAAADFLQEEKHERVAVLQNNLATVYSDLGEHSRARGLLEAALQSGLDNFGPAHPTVAVRHNNLAHVFVAQEEWEEAKKHFSQALSIAQKALGEGHPHTKLFSEMLSFVEGKMG